MLASVEQALVQLDKAQGGGGKSNGSGSNHDVLSAAAAHEVAAEVRFRKKHQNIPIAS